MQQMSINKLDLSILNEICNWFSTKLTHCQQHANSTDISQIISSVIFLTLYNPMLNDNEHLKRLSQDLNQALQEPIVMSQNIKTSDEGLEAIKFITLLCKQCLIMPEKTKEQLFSAAIEAYNNNEANQRKSSKGSRGSLNASAKSLFFRNGETSPQRRHSIVARPTSAPYPLAVQAPLPPPLDLAGLSTDSSVSSHSSVLGPNSPGNEYETYNVNVTSSDPAARQKFISGLSNSDWKSSVNQRLASNNPIRIRDKTVTLRLWDDINDSNYIPGLSKDPNTLSSTEYKTMDAFLIVCDVADNNFCELLRKKSAKLIKMHPQIIFILLITNFNNVSFISNIERNLAKLTALNTVYRTIYDYTQRELNPADVLFVSREIAELIAAGPEPRQTDRCLLM